MSMTKIGETVEGTCVRSSAGAHPYLGPESLTQLILQWASFPLTSATRLVRYGGDLDWSCFESFLSR